MYDLAIIGGGPAGYSAALEATSHGLKVILFEKETLGGTCLNRGCVPTKYLAHVAELYAQLQNADTYGISIDNRTLNYVTCIQKKNDVVLKLRTGLEQLIRSKKIDLINHSAKIINPRTILAGNIEYQARNILIASGSISSTPFVENALTSSELLNLNYVPKTMKIIGGGVIAIEFAHIFSLLGTKIDIYIRGESLLRKWDRELALSVTQNLKRKGVTIHTNCSLEQMQATDSFDVIFFAAGRTALTQGLFDESIKIQCRDGIVTDKTGRTNIPGIYAAGDVITGSCQLAHVAMDQGRRVVKDIIGQIPKQDAAIVKCIYLHPEIATVGLSEIDAKNQGLNVITGKYIMLANARTLISTTERGFIKLIADYDSLQLIGAQLMCERASDIINELALAINNKITVPDLINSIRPHPSYCEGITEAAMALLEKKNAL